MTILQGSRDFLLALDLGAWLVSGALLGVARGDAGSWEAGGSFCVLAHHVGSSC